LDILLAPSCGGREFHSRAIGRDGKKLEGAFSGQAKIHAADIHNPDQTARALEGCDTAIYAVGLPYPEHKLHPVLMRKAIDAMRRAGVSRMALSSSVYAYGAPQAERVSETHPREPHSRKGRYRKEQEAAALEADGEGGLRCLVLRLPDFYGPHATLSLAGQVFQGALAGKAANWIGPADRPREFIFVPTRDRFCWICSGGRTASGRRGISEDREPSPAGRSSIRFTAPRGARRNFAR
jgi:nucleoside-diphosphate-sugar epimerase